MPLAKQPPKGGKLDPLPLREQTGTTINKIYKLGDVIGKGSHGVVYKSLKMDTGDIVAIKQIRLSSIPKEQLSGMVREIDLLNRLDHPNIVKYVASVKTKDYFNIVLEYIENGSLANTVKKFGSLPESLIAIYIEQVLQGLQYLHTQGVIHRDIKGANILTTKEGHVKLADFGVATRMGDSGERASSADYEDVAGTPYWMAPEIIEMSPASPASDVWSVGATIIELLTGAPPYFDLAAMPALFRIVSDPHPPLPEGVSSALREMLMLCFKKDPSTRITAKQLLHHKWITSFVARRQDPEEVRQGRGAPGESAIRGQDWSEVVERTLELHEAAQRERKSRGGALPGHVFARSVVKGGTISNSVTAPPGWHALAPTTDLHATAPTSSGDGASARAPAMLSNGREAGAEAEGNAAGVSRISARSRESSLRFGAAASLPRSPSGADGALNVKRWAEKEEEEGGDWGLDLDSSGKLPFKEQREDHVLQQLQLVRTGASSPEQDLDWDAASDDGHLAPEASASQRLPATVPPNLKKFTEDKQTEDELDELELPANNRISRPQVVRPEDLRGSGSISTFQDRFGKYQENQMDDELLDLDIDGNDEEEGEALQVVLRKKLRGQEERGRKGSVGGSWSEEEEDPFEDAPLEMQSLGLHGDGFAMVEAEMLRLCTQLDPEGEPDEQMQTCQALEQLLLYHGEQKSNLIVHHQVLPLLEMLDSSHDQVVIRALRVIHEAVTNRQRQAGGDYTGHIGIIGPLVDNMLTVGLVHRLLALCGRELAAADELSRAAVQNAVLVLHSLCWGAEARHVQTIVACQGIPVLVNLLSSDPPLNHLAVECLWRIINLPPPTPKTDFCRLLARGKAARKLVLLLDHAFADYRQGLKDKKGATQTGWFDVSVQHADKVASIFLLFSQADRVVKEDMAQPFVLETLLSIVATVTEDLHHVLAGASIKILKALRNLSGDPNSLKHLQEAHAVKLLVPLLSIHANNKSKLASEVENQVMLALYNLCKISKARQEQAAQAGIVVSLQRLIKSNSPLRQLAIPLLCDLAHATDACRKALWVNDGLSFYLNLLNMKYWDHVALNCVAVWVASAKDKRPFEEVLVRDSNAKILTNTIIEADPVSASKLIPPLIPILECEGLNQLLGKSQLVSELLKRLLNQDHQAVDRKTILHCIQLMYERSRDPKAFITTHNLMEVLSTVVETDESVLVRERANELLQATLVNTVL